MKFHKFSDFNFKEVDYSQYRQELSSELNTLVAQSINTDTKLERKLQSFFERYPSAILGALTGVPSHHNIFGNVIISQPQIKDYSGDRRPDFLVVTSNSLELYFNFIEIESPNKQIFKGDKVELHSDFYQAYGQLHQWKANIESLKAYIGHLKKNLFCDNFNLSRKTDKINYVLLYGNSDELISSPSNRQREFLSDFLPANIYHSTYSRLISNLYIPGGMFSVKRNSNDDTYSAIGITPFKTYETSEWSDFHNVTGKEEVIQSCPYLTETERNDVIKEIRALDPKNISEIHKLQLEEPATDLSGSPI